MNEFWLPNGFEHRLEQWTQKCAHLELCPLNFDLPVSDGRQLQIDDAFSSLWDRKLPSVVVTSGLRRESWSSNRSSVL